MLIEINSKWALDNDEHQWIVIERTPYENKKGEMVIRENKSYPGTLMQACLIILDRDPVGAESVEQIVTMIEEIGKKLLEAIEK